MKRTLIFDDNIYQFYAFDCLLVFYNSSDTHCVDLTLCALLIVLDILSATIVSLLHLYTLGQGRRSDFVRSRLKQSLSNFT